MPPRTRRRTPDEQAAADAAEAEIKALRQALDDAEAAVVTAREALAEGLVKHLAARALSPTEAGAASKYDAKHVGRIAKAGGVPPLRPPTTKAIQPATD
ncbi:hypothetical protein ABZW02_20140 [Streptomyces sp. NPDC005180]|uniref:hypothetical protein n=1 Tax=Streptomyces sp. NPDC005180 TaxID=3156868 RepID=UPI0033B85EE9